jgi:hypothetical protein
MRSIIIAAVTLLSVAAITASAIAQTTGRNCTTTCTREGPTKSCTRSCY